MWNARLLGTGSAAMISGFVVAGSLLLANRDDGGTMKGTGHRRLG
jgi:hypothetical protein